MKKLTIIFIAVLFVTLCIDVFGQAKSAAFRVTVSGKGKQAVLFIPGFASSGDVWKETSAQYESKFTCYTFTMAGFAGVPAQANPTFKGWEDAIAVYIQQNKIVNPIVIGHSMGGGLALALAADYPQLIGKIVVVDALPCLAAMMDPSFKSKENNDCSAMVAQFTSMSDDQFYKMQLQSMPRLVADTGKLKQIVSWSVKSDRKTFAQMYCDFSNTDLREKIATIKCPALILLEAYFANFKPAINDQYKKLKTGQLQYATKGLHFIMYDDTAWYNAQLAAFVK